MLQGDMSLLMAHLVRCPETISVASGVLFPAELAEHTGDGMLGHMWECSRDYYDKYTKTIPQTFLIDKAREYMSDMLVADDAITELAQFIEWIYGAPNSDFNHDEVVSHLGDVLRIVKVVRPFEAGIASGENLDNLLDKAQQGLSDSSAGKVERLDPLACFDEIVGSRSPTVLGDSTAKYFNVALNGGVKPGEMIVIMAPTGGFKTTMMIDVMCSMAKMQQYSLLLAHEQAIKGGDIPSQFAARLSGVSREILEEVPKEKYDADTVKALADSRKYGKYTMLADRTNNADPISSIVKIMEECVKDGCKPEILVIDQLLTWIGKWEGVDDRPDSLRKAVTACTLALKHKVAERFGTTVILLHQIASGSITKLGGSVYQHTDSSESKSIANWTDFTLTIGSMDEETNVVKFNSSKTRRGKPKITLVKVLPLTCEFRLADDYQETRYSTGKFVKKGEASKMPTVSQPSGGLKPAI